MEYKETFLQEGKSSKIILNFINKNRNIITSSIIKVILTLNSSVPQNTINRSSRPKAGTVHLTVLNNLICLCVTGQQDEVKTTSGRIVSLTAYVTSLVLLAAYSAFLISSLAVYDPDLPFRDLQGLLKDGSYKIRVVKDSYNYEMFQV